MNQTNTLRIDRDRLWSSIMDMAKIGPGIAGGNNRQALTDEDGEARRLFAHWCEADGLSVSVDAMGNMFARREGAEPALAPVVAGSHLDTQPTGGKYDGVLGVLAALEAVRRLNEAGIVTGRPIEIVNWTNEEGSRFAPSMIGSAVWSGAYDLATAYAIEDADGAALGAELERIGFRGAIPCRAQDWHAFYELHIEQGPVLEEEGLEIGVVTHGQGLCWTEISLTGRESHTGSTPMPRRRNAGLGMARITEAVHRIALDHGPEGVGAVGHCILVPNSRNIIAGKAVFTADMRHPDPEALTAMTAQLEEAGRQVAAELGLDVAFRNVGHFAPVAFDSACVARVRDAARLLGYGHRDMISGAGHDACFVNRVVPTAMIFCPCVDGLSHNEAEDISPQWAEAGANVLLHAVLESAENIEAV